MVNANSYDFFLNADMTPYAGEWVAIVDRKVVSHGLSPKHVFKEAKRCCPRRRPLVTRIPGNKAMIL